MDSSSDARNSNTEGDSDPEDKVEEEVSDDTKTSTSPKQVNPPGLHLSKNALKKQRRKQNAKNIMNNETEKPSDEALPDFSEKVQMFNKITEEKHRLSPEEKARSVRQKSTSEA